MKWTCYKTYIITEYSLSVTPLKYTKGAQYIELIIKDENVICSILIDVLKPLNPLPQVTKFAVLNIKKLNVVVYS